MNTGAQHFVADNGAADESPCSGPLAGLEAQVDGLRAAGADFWRRGWSLGTSSNYSVVLSHEPLEMLVTASGKDKGRLSRGDFVRVGPDGGPTSAGQPKSSAETLLHVVLAADPAVGAVLHTHSVWATLLSEHYAGEGGLEIGGYEMLKGLEGITTHESSAWLEIFENTQDIATLSDLLAGRMSQPQSRITHGFLIRRHGLYTWGRDLAAARRHIEIWEFLLECEARRLMLSGQLAAAAV